MTKSFENLAYSLDSTHWPVHSVILSNGQCPLSRQCVLRLIADWFAETDLDRSRLGKFPLENAEDRKNWEIFLTGSRWLSELISQSGSDESVYYENPLTRVRWNVHDESMMNWSFEVIWMISKWQKVSFATFELQSLKKLLKKSHILCIQPVVELKALHWRKSD